MPSPAPALASDAKPAPKPDPAKGQAIATPGLRRLPHRRRLARPAGQPDPAGAASRVPGQAVARLQVRQAQQRHHEGLRHDAERRGHEATWRRSTRSKTAKPGFAKNKDTLLLGERIYRGGIADRKIAACAGCHSPNGAGIPAQYPRLGGQHGDYTEAQLIAFRSGARANSPQMTGIAAKLNDREIKAVADYIAGLR